MQCACKIAPLVIEHNKYLKALPVQCLRGCLCPK